MGIYYNTAYETDAVCEATLTDNIAAVSALLKQLKSLQQRIGKSTSGDADFDVELTVSIDVARAALIRYNALLNDKLRPMLAEFEKECERVFVRF